VIGTIWGRGYMMREPEQRSVFAPLPLPLPPRVVRAEVAVDPEAALNAA